MNAAWATALAWLLTAVVVGGVAYLAWLVLKKIGLTVEQRLARLGERLKDWASTPFAGAGSGGRAAGRAGRAAWDERAGRPGPGPSPATTDRQERWGQTGPGRAAVRAERGAARTGRAVGRWTGAGTAAVGSGVKAIPGGWREGVEHVRDQRRRRTQGDRGPGPATTVGDPPVPTYPPDPAQGPDDTGRRPRRTGWTDSTDDAKGPDGTGDAEGPDGTGDAEGPDGTGDDAKGPDGTGDDAKGPDGTDPAEGPAKGPDSTDGTTDGAKGPDDTSRRPRRTGWTDSTDDAKGPDGTGDDAKGPDGTDPAEGPGGAAGTQDGTTERTGQAGAPDTKEIEMAEMTEFTNTGDLRAEVEELETTAEELAEQVAEFHRRRELVEEKLGAAPFGTRAIAEAASAVSDAKTLEEAQEALGELRRAVDESDAVADVAEGLDAKGDVEAFANA